MGICEKIWSSGVSPKKASKMELRDVNLRSVGPSVQKLWPTTFFAKKMPCILHGAAIKIRDTISSQVSGRAQLPGVIIYIVDQKSNPPISGGHTSIILSHPSGHLCKFKLLVENRSVVLMIINLYKSIFDMKGRGGFILGL